MPDTVEAKKDPHDLTGDQTRFIAELLGQNARWSASIHNAALDGQERASNEWAGRYLQLVRRLCFLLGDATKWDRETELFDRLDDIVGDQSFWPESAHDQLKRYRERLETEKAERDGIPV